MLENAADSPQLAPDVMQRLAFIRDLYSVGMEQSRQPEPLSTISILSWHDSVELFLHLAAERTNIELKGKERIEFNDYFGRINDRISPRRLDHQASMRRLNDVRVALKHRGVMTAKVAVEHLRADVTRFFQDNTPLIFNIPFDAVSLVDLVVYEATRLRLKSALEHLENGNTSEAAEQTSIAFAQLLLDHEQLARNRYGGSPFWFIESSPFPSSFRHRTIADPEQDNFNDQTTRSLGALQDVLRMVTMGVDYRRYAKFRHYMPVVHHFPRACYALGTLVAWKRNPPAKRTHPMCLMKNGPSWRPT
jgi:hypothetical protein